MLGRVVGRMMARRNATLTQRTIAALHLRGDETVLEIGPGPGVGLLLAESFAARPEIIGAEPSSAMRAQAASRTRHFSDRVQLLDATADSLSLPAASINPVYAINNVQLWQPLPPRSRSCTTCYAPAARWLSASPRMPCCPVAA